MVVYDKDGKAYDVKYAVDIKEWLSNGYFINNPKEPKKKDK